MPLAKVRSLFRVYYGSPRRLLTDNVLSQLWRGVQGARFMSKLAISMDILNPNIVKLQYAVRGPLVLRASDIDRQLREGTLTTKSYKNVIRANVGDAHAMDQKPITYYRQVLASIVYPVLMEKGDFPSDVITRAKQILAACPGQSIGSYSNAHGMELVRRDVADYLQQRDGHPAIWENICLSAGTTPAIKSCLELFANSKSSKPIGIMIPTPQYPLYSATITEYGLVPVRYYLNEEADWSVDESELERALASASNYNVRALVVINPGNPTGQVFTRKNIEMILKFVRKHNMIIFNDEVYQQNVHADGTEFISFKKVLSEMGDPCNTVELVSFMSVSKGFMAECGCRGGWMELVNLEPEVQANLYKVLSAALCPSIPGQTIVDLVARPPKKGDPSYELYFKQKSAIMASLKQRADTIEKGFNSIEGFKCNPVKGAMYAFPSFSLPPKAIEAAKKDGKPADLFYCFDLLEEAGICVVPGSGFGQRPGTHHFRTTILPQPAMLQEMLDTFKKFHIKFIKKYS